MGCPNFCNGEEEMERRRAAEVMRQAEEEAEKAAAEAAALADAIEMEAAERRTASNAELQGLRSRQREEMARFLSFERRMRWVLWNRHSQGKTLVSERYRDLADKMRERHARTVAHLEDRQIAAEMDLRTALDAMEKSVRIRLKHMEAYCEALGRPAPNADGNSPATTPRMPQRVVTERDLRELGQQYNLRDGMERLHAAKINVMRDRQQKQVEELLERQERELARLLARRADELEQVVAAFNNDDEAASATFADRRARLSRRWDLAAEVLRHRIQDRDAQRLAPLHPLAWPAEVSTPLLNDVVDDAAVPDEEAETKTAAIDLAPDSSVVSEKTASVTCTSVLVQ